MYMYAWAGGELEKVKQSLPSLTISGPQESCLTAEETVVDLWVDNSVKSKQVWR